MRFEKLKLSAVLFLGLALTELQAQNTLPATGGNASGSGGTVSYSVGQVVYTTNDGGVSGSVAQGVQQPFEISVVIGIKETESITLVCSVYPNPSKDLITLKINDFDISNLSYQLLDINGKLLDDKKIVNNETSIAMSVYAKAIYFLKVIQINQEVKSFKIIKN